MKQVNNTICALATSLGGAIAVIRVSGSKSIDYVNNIFSKDISKSNGYTVHYGTISSIDGKQIDDVLVTIFRSPHSYTGEDSIEISCHASSFIVNEIVKLLTDNGCSLAKPGEFTQRAFLNGKMDLSQAEAVLDIIQSQNLAQHRVAMSQMRGMVSRKLMNLRNKMLKLTSLLELELDFSDHEDIEFADRTELLSIALQIKEEISHLTSSFSEGNAIKNGVPVAIVGAPNVGKSTLLNSLLQEDKAIVSDIAGTTRDAIEDTVNINGILYRIIDTAGIRKTDDTIEKLGIKRSEIAAEKAHIIIMMRDYDNDYPLINLRKDQKVIRVFNKSENFQAIKGLGLDWLKNEIVRNTPQAANDETVLITNARHHEVLELAYKDICRAYESIKTGLSCDLVSEDLRQCLHHLAEITGGEITNNEVLENIFKNFCIGK